MNEGVDNKTRKVSWLSRWAHLEDGALLADLSKGRAQEWLMMRRSSVFLFWRSLGLKLPQLSGIGRQQARAASKNPSILWIDRERVSWLGKVCIWILHWESGGLLSMARATIRVSMYFTKLLLDVI